MGSDPKRTTVRNPLQARILGAIAGWIIRLAGGTLRMELVDRCGLAGPGQMDRPLIWCLWHNRVFVGSTVWSRFCTGRRASVLTSASKDGAVLAAAIGVVGMDAVRGSSSRRGATALKELLRVIRGGADVAVTPDGPRGPRYVLQPGVVKLAQASGAPIVPIHVEYGRAWKLKSWDRFHIPWPFSKVTITFDESLAVPRDLDDDAFEAVRRKLEETMRNGVQDYDESSDGNH